MANWRNFDYTNSEYMNGFISGYKLGCVFRKMISFEDLENAFKSEQDVPTAGKNVINSFQFRFITTLSTKYWDGRDVNHENLEEFESDIHHVSDYFTLQV